MFCLWLKLANLWNWDEIFRHNVTKTLSFSSVTSGTCWSFHYSNFEVPRGPCSSVSFVFTLVYYHHFSESDIFRHGVTKTLVQFLEKLLSGLEQGKNLKFFTRVSFYHYLSIIHQANIKNVLYSLSVGSSRPKLESLNKAVNPKKKTCCHALNIMGVNNFTQCLVQIVTSRSLALWLGSFPLHKICWRYNNCISITFIQLQELFRRLQIVVSARSMLMC